MFAQGKLRLLGCLCLMFAIILMLIGGGRQLSWPAFIVWVCVFVSTCMMTITLLRVSFLTAPKYDDALLLIYRYISANVFDWFGIYYKKQLEFESLHCMSTQEKFLMKTLSEMAQTVYGRDHGFAKMVSMSDFRTRHPLTTYAYYRSYVDRVVHGEENVVLPEKVTKLATTSGTTGLRKIIIPSKRRNSVFVLKIGAMVSHVVSKRYDPGLSPLQTTCFIYVHTNPKVSELGIAIGPTSILQFSDIICRINFSTPPAGMRLTSENHAMYVHLLFALRDRTLKTISAFFAPILYSFFSLLEDEWQDLVEDVRQGKLSARLSIDADIRVALESELEPDPERAAELTEEIQKGFVGIARRIWPWMKSMQAICSGSAAVYHKRLQATYTKGIPIVSTFYGATEGTIGTMYGEDHQYIITPSNLFYEFIPIEHSFEDQPDTLLANEVKVGETYELAITNFDGLYRYRIGDVIKVTNFHNNAPILDFQYRLGEFLNLKGEKTPEVNLRSALVDTLKASGKVLVDYSGAESVLYEEAIGHSDLKNKVYYVIFAELETDTIRELDIDEITSEVDTRLQTYAAGYRVHRQRDGIGQLKLVIVQSGAFENLRAYILEKNVGASAVTTKIPKKLRKAEWIHLLADRDIKKGEINTGMRF